MNGKKTKRELIIDLGRWWWWVDWLGNRIKRIGVCGYEGMGWMG